MSSSKSQPENNDNAIMKRFQSRNESTANTDFIHFCVYNFLLVLDIKSYKPVVACQWIWIWYLISIFTSDIP